MASALRHRAKSISFTEEEEEARDDEDETEEKRPLFKRWKIRNKNKYAAVPIPKRRPAFLRKYALKYALVKITRP